MKHLPNTHFPLSSFTRCGLSIGNDNITATFPEVDCPKCLELWQDETDKNLATLLSTLCDSHLIETETKISAPNYDAAVTIAGQLKQADSTINPRIVSTAGRYKVIFSQRA